jgi:multidrug efflux pump subunit AcrB
LNKPFTILLIWATLSIAGLAFLPLLHVQWQPSRTLPSITVSYSWQNVSGRVMEQEVTTMLEGGLNRIRGIRKITSVSRNNSGYITIEFDKTIDMDAARFEVASAVRQLYPKLPDGVSFPTLSLNRPNNEQEKSLLVYTLQASANPAGIQQYAEEQIKPVLAQIEGVSRIAVYGASSYEWMIEYDAEQLRAAGLTPYILQQAVSRYYSVESLGMVRDADAASHNAWMQLTIGNTDASRTRLEEIPLQVANGRLLYLSDIATVRYIEQEPTSYYRINGRNTVNIVIYASSQANHIVLAQQIDGKIKEMEFALPKGYHLLNTYNSTEYISEELDKIYIRTIATICILLLFILLMTRNFRFLAIVLLSIVANICVALGLYYFLNIEIHLYSLAGITISLGLIIDNTIVMVEHIRSRGDRRVFLAILAATLTTAIALSSVFFLDDRIKLDLSDFAIVVIVNLLVSLASAWFLTPALFTGIAGQQYSYSESLRTANTPGTFHSEQDEAKAMKKQKKKSRFDSLRRKKRLAFLSRIYTSVISIISRRRRIAWGILILAFGLPVFLLPNKIEKKGFWSDVYNKTLGNLWYVEKAKPVVDKVLGGALRLFAQFVYEGSQWNAGRERTTLMVTANMPPGATIVQMNEAMESLEKYLSDFSEIDMFTTNIHNAQNARMEITFKKEYEFSYFPYYLKSQLITWGVNAGAADWTVSGLGDGFSNRIDETSGSYRIQLFGYNYEQLYEYAEDIRRQLMENPRIKEVNIMSRYTWYKNINREFALTPDIERLSMSGISLPFYFNMVSNASGNERTATGAVIDGSYRQIRYRAKQLSETDRWLFYNSLLQSGESYLKLASVSEMIKEPEQREICKEDQQYTLSVSYDYIGSSRFGNKLHEQTVNEINEVLPLGFKAEGVGGWGWWTKSKKQYWLIVLILVVMYVLCSILFESLWQPFAVISLVPFAFIGLFLTFYLFHLNFDQGGFAALVLLCGLTVNAAIYIINDYNNLKKDSVCSPRRLYIQALHGKIMPVLLTILSTVLGLIPFVVGEHREPFWFALAAGTMGGLLFSLTGILFYLPLFFFRRKKR